MKLSDNTQQSDDNLTKPYTGPIDINGGRVEITPDGQHAILFGQNYDARFNLGDMSFVEGTRAVTSEGGATSLEAISADDIPNYREAVIKALNS